MNGGKSGNSCLKKRTQERGWQGRVLALIGVGWTGKKKETVGDISVSPPASTRLGLLRMWWGYFMYKHTHTQAYTQTHTGFYNFQLVKKKKKYTVSAKCNKMQHTWITLSVLKMRRLRLRDSNCPSCQSLRGGIQTWLSSFTSIPPFFSSFLFSSPFLLFTVYFEGLWSAWI